MIAPTESYLDLVIARREVHVLKKKVARMALWWGITSAAYLATIAYLVFR